MFNFCVAKVRKFNTIVVRISYTVTKKKKSKKNIGHFLL